MIAWHEWLTPTAGIGLGIFTMSQTIGLLTTNRATHSTIRRDMGKITMVCYLFCLSSYLTAISGAWLCWSGQVTDVGQPQSELAKFAFLIAREALVIQRELALVAVLLSIVIVPQLLNYLVAGVFGAAGTTRFGAWCLKFVFWTTVKGFAVAGGVSVAWGAIAMWMHWPKAYDDSPSNLIGNGMAQVSFSVLFGTLGGPLDTEARSFARSGLKPLLAKWMPIHRWMTRNLSSHAGHSSTES